MKWLGFLFSALFFAAPVGTPAEAWFRHGSAAATCPYGTGSGDNGCAAANQNGSFQDTSLLTAAQQSSQISLFPLHATVANNIVPFNIPGIDYPIGPDKTLTPRDPRTISDGICTYHNNGGSPLVELVLCDGSGVVTETLNNYDFGGKIIGQGPVELYFDSKPLGASAGSTITVTNSYFNPPAGTGSRFGFGYAVGYQGNWNIVFKNNQCDGADMDLNSDECFRDDGETFGTTIDIEYSVFTHVNKERVMGNGANSGIAQTWKYNYIRGLNDLNTTSHGEVSLLSCGGGSPTNCLNKTLDHHTIIGNFVISNSLTDAYCVSGGGAGGCNNSATWFLSNGQAHGIYVTTTTFQNNVQITNNTGAPGGGPATPTTPYMWGYSGFSGVWPTDSLTVTNNWIDGTGSTGGCFTNGPSNALSSTTASTSGNTINITAFGGNYSNNPIDIGWVIKHSGFTDAKITAFVSGAGGAGTYTFSGPAQTLGSDSAWTIVPNIGSLTASGNKSLADPTNTGIAASIDPSGPTLIANCPGAH